MRRVADSRELGLKSNLLAEVSIFLVTGGGSRLQVAVILPMPATWHRECYTQPRGRGVIYRVLASMGQAESRPRLWSALQEYDAIASLPVERAAQPYPRHPRPRYSMPIGTGFQFYPGPVPEHLHQRPEGRDLGPENKRRELNG